MIKNFLSAMSIRIFLIIITGVLLTAVIVNILGQRDSRANESSMREQFTFERIENIIRILEATVPEKRTEIQDVFARMGSRVTFNVASPQQSQTLPPELANLNALLVPEIADQIQPSQDCSFRRGFHPIPVPGQKTGTGFARPQGDRLKPNGQCLAVYAHLEDGTPILIDLHYGRRPPREHAEEHQPFSILLLLTGLIGITWGVASLTTKPIRKLGQAALQLANNIEHPPLPENAGPIEVRHAARAFNEMQRSIIKHVQERGFILGAIAHDLQTPLTRLRLRLEKVKDNELKQNLIKDLTATQEMVKEGLDFARLCSENIHKSKVDLIALATAVCDDFEDAGHAVNKTLPGESITIMGSAHLLSRCLTNLLGNAINYAQSPALSIHRKDGRVLFVISDDGPGIPEHELDAVLEPFRRVEDSRSRHTGGTGLGLSIARMIVEKHGGSMTLSNKPAPNSGLVIHIELPIN